MPSILTFCETPYIDVCEVFLLIADYGIRLCCVLDRRTFGGVAERTPQRTVKISLFTLMRIDTCAEIRAVSSCSLINIGLIRAPLYPTEALWPSALYNLVRYHVEKNLLPKVP